MGRNPHFYIMIPEKLYSEHQRDLLIDHLLSLSKDDLYLRFGYQISEEQIRKYVERSYDFDTDISQWFGVFCETTGKIIASLHTIMVTSKKAEMGCTVDAACRNQGIGQKLFDRGLIWARANGAKTIYMQCLSQNQAIQKIAKRNNMLVATMGYDEKEGKLEFPLPDLTAPFSDVTLDRIAAVDSIFRQPRNAFTKIINLWTKKGL